MEEISSTLAVPFRLNNMTSDESALQTQIEITGFKLIASTAGLLSEHPGVLSPSISDYGAAQDLSSGSKSSKSGNFSVLTVSADEDESGRGGIFWNTVGNEMKLTPEDGKVHTPYACGQFINYSCSYTVASDTTNACHEESVPVKASFEKNSMTVSDATLGSAPNANKLGELEPRQELRRTASRSVLEVDYVPLWGLTSICGTRSEMEDAVAVVPWLLKIPSLMLASGQNLELRNQHSKDLTAHFFGVYDGHGGSQVASYCQERIHLALEEEMEVAKRGFRDGSSWSNGKEQLEKALSSCFLKVDDEVCGVSRSMNGSDPSLMESMAPETVGSTAVVGLVCSTHIIIANCGDSRAVLYRGKETVPLSVDHKPNREDECARIEAVGGRVIQWDGFRVCGVLAMSRAIGDRYLKPSIIPDPEVVFFPRAKEDECLILASDGLWDVVTNEEACDMARRRILLWHKKNGDNLPAERGEGIDPAAQAAADYLSKLALQRGSRDNISVIVIDLKAQRKFKKKIVPETQQPGTVNTKL
ncbi:hypothetical protein BT93_K0350 [Corymbia citriodora subsp. variegata]|nr:hypothetical protein BT93_K0350 [Corymbia citriodora subsp. variegata]